MTASGTKASATAARPNSAGETSRASAMAPAKASTSPPTRAAATQRTPEKVASRSESDFALAVWPSVCSPASRIRPLVTNEGVGRRLAHSRGPAGRKPARRPGVGSPDGSYRDRLGANGCNRPSGRRLRLRLHELERCSGARADDARGPARRRAAQPPARARPGGRRPGPQRPGEARASSARRPRRCVSRQRGRAAAPAAAAAQMGSDLAARRRPLRCVLRARVAPGVGARRARPPRGHLCPSRDCRSG